MVSHMTMNHVESCSLTKLADDGL